MKMLLSLAVWTVCITSLNAFLQSNYTSLNATDKCNILWGEISKNPYNLSSLPTAPVDPAYLAANKFDWTFLQTTFTWTDDEMPPGRLKVLHQYGSVCKVKLRIRPHSPFTGIFSTGACGILRMSLTEFTNDTFPVAIALKIFIDGRKSENLVLLNSDDGQGANRNFFAKNMRNVFPAPEPLGRQLSRLHQAQQTAVLLLPGGQDNQPVDFNNIPLRAAASVGSDGVNVSVPVVPYIISFRPNPALSSLSYVASDPSDFRLRLAKIPKGTLLYTVAATRFDEDDSTVIGTLTSESQVMATLYGDQVLFFSHPHIRSLFNWQ